MRRPRLGVTHHLAWLQLLAGGGASLDSVQVLEDVVIVRHEVLLDLVERLLDLVRGNELVIRLHSRGGDAAG